MQANARLSERAPFFAEVDVLSTGAHAPRRVWGTDVSETGIFLQTTHPFRVGDRVSLRFDVEENEVHVRAAEVMWVRPFEPIAVDGKLPGIGVRFVAIDPPARAALRRVVRTGQDKRKGDTTLPNPECQAIPSLPPARASLPPATQSILMATSTKPITDEMFAISLAPFTEPPKKREPKLPTTSLPPDEPLGFDAPRPVTMLPVKKKSTPPLGSIPPVNLLAGWTFKKEEVAEALVIESAPPKDAAMPAPKFDLRFDDDAPGTTLAPIAPDEEPSLVLAPPSEVIAHDDEPEPELAGLDNALGDDNIAISGLPVAHERRTAHRRRPGPLPIAATLLVAGTLVGTGIGMWSKRALPTAAPVAQVARVADAAPVVVVAEPVIAQPPAPTPAPVPAPPTTPLPIEAVADVEKEIPKAAAPKPAVAPKGNSVIVDAGPAARVKKTFTLEGPPRIVVDMTGAALQKGAQDPKVRGVSRVRIGSPEPGVSRVVVELDGKSASQASARVEGGRLAIHWK